MYFQLIQQVCSFLLLGRDEVRRDEEYVGKGAMGIQVQGSRRRGRPKKRWADCVKDDLREKGLSAEEVYD